MFEILINTLTGKLSYDVRGAVAKVGDHKVVATLDNHSVYVDDQLRACFDGCSGAQLQTLFFAVVEQVKDSINYKENQ